jgi:5-methylcytosine-specific restriction endonuclease McrA
VTAPICDACADAGMVMELPCPIHGSGGVTTATAGPESNGTERPGGLITGESDVERFMGSLLTDEQLIEEASVTVIQGGEFIFGKQLPEAPCIAMTRQGNSCGAAGTQVVAGQSFCWHHLRVLKGWFRDSEYYRIVVPLEQEASQAQLDRDLAKQDLAKLSRKIRAGERRLAALRRSIGARERVPKALARRIAERDRHRCVYCGGAGDETTGPDGATWHLDHVIPHIRGGPAEETNLVLACRRCNLRKGDRTPAEFVDLLMQDVIALRLGDRGA